MDENGFVIRNKPGIVAQHLTQFEGLGYDETISPVARWKEIKLIFVYESYMNFKVFYIDVKTTFLHDDIQEESFLK